MQIQIRAVTNAKKERIVKEGEIYPHTKRETAKGANEEISRSGVRVYKIYVSAPPEGGRANARIIELLAKQFKIKKNQIEIIKGLKSKEKIIVINL